MDEQASLNAATMRLHAEREKLNTLIREHADAATALGVSERKRLAAASDPAAYVQACAEERACREECNRLATLSRDTQPKAVAAAERDLQQARWQSEAAHFAAAYVRLHDAYAKAVRDTAAHWASIVQLSAAIAEAQEHASAMAQTGERIPRDARDFLDLTKQLAGLPLPKERDLMEHAGQGAAQVGRGKVMAAIAAAMRQHLGLPQHRPTFGYPAYRQILEMLSGRYMETLRDFERRASKEHAGVGQRNPSAPEVLGAKRQGRRTADTASPGAFFVVRDGEMTPEASAEESP